MNGLYGNISDKQLAEYKKKLHSKMFWLLLYKDPKSTEQYSYVDYDQYFNNLMREINGFADIIDQHAGMLELMSLLQAAYNETKNSPFDYHTYRKFILDAHNLLDEIMEVA